MLVVVTRFSNDESARPPKLTKVESTTNISIDQVHKFQNNYFKEYQWKAATILQKACILRTYYEKALPLKLIEKLNASTFVSSFLNIV